MVLRVQAAPCDQRNGGDRLFVSGPGSTDDRSRAAIGCLCRDLWGKLFGDRGYISKELFEPLYLQGIQLITRLKKEMKNALMDIGGKLLLRKRAVIESVSDFLKNICQVEHTCNRSLVSFMVNLLATLVAYGFLPRKPSLRTKGEKELALILG